MTTYCAYCGHPDGSHFTWFRKWRAHRCHERGCKCAGFVRTISWDEILFDPNVLER